MREIIRYGAWRLGRMLLFLTPAVLVVTLAEGSMIPLGDALPPHLFGKRNPQVPRGLLLASALMTIRASRVLYLGPDTPADQTAAVGSTGHVDAVATGISAATARTRASKAPVERRNALPFPAMPSAWAWDEPFRMPRDTT